MQKKIKFNISGMHCRSCKTLIETEVKTLPGVKKIQANHQTGECELEFDEKKITKEKIFKQIENLNYQVNNSGEKNKKPIPKFISRSFIFISLIILGGGYLLVKNLGGFELLAELNESRVGYGLIFIIGLLAGFHCVGMCGGLVIAYSVKTKEHPRATARQERAGINKFIPHVEYNLGRIISYTLIGGILGGLGSFFGINPIFTGTIIILASIFMILMGLSFLTGWQILEKIKLRTPDFIVRYIYKQNQEKKFRGSFIVGLLNGFMPCGPLQAIQLYALASGDIVRGALSLGVYALGTAVIMFIFGLTISSISNQNIKKMIKVSGIIVIILGIFMANRGLANFGFGFIPQKADSQIITENNTNKDFQEVRMELTYLGYEPNVLYIKPDIPVRWIIDVKQMSGCTNAIMIESLGIKKSLEYGENIIEFTPPKNTKEIKFSCWMRMVWGKFIVTNDTSASKNTAPAAENLPLSGTCNGNCGSATCGATQGGSCGCGGK